MKLSALVLLLRGGTCTRSCDALLLRGVVLKNRLAKPLSPPSGEALALAAAGVVDAEQYTEAAISILWLFLRLGLIPTVVLVVAVAVAVAVAVV